MVYWSDRGEGATDNGVTEPALDLSRPESPTRCFSALSFAILIGGLITVAVTVHMVATTYSALPYSDAWTEVNAAVRGTNLLSPQWLWQQHNEHRIVLPKLFLAADFLLFRYRQTFCLTSILFIQAAHLVLLSWALWVLGGWRGAVWRTAVGAIAFALFCPSQWENFVWGFQTCFVLPGLLATLSFVGLALLKHADDSPLERRSWNFLLLSIVAALGAQYSLANGNLVWPLLIGGALYMRLRRREALVYVLCGVISTAAFFHNYVLSSTPGGLANSLHAPLSVCTFTFAYLGSVWTSQVAAAAILGGAAFAASVLLAVFLRSMERSRGLYVVLVLSLLFGAGTAATTAVARLQFGMTQAFTSRYQTPALLFWAELFLLLLLAAVEKRWSVSALVFVEICLIAMFARGAYLARYPIRQARWHGFQINAAGAALLSGVEDARQFHYGAVDVRHIAEDAPYLKQQKLSIFAGRFGDMIGVQATPTFSLANTAGCGGAIQSVTQLSSDGFRISGWAWDFARRKPPSHIVVVQENRIVGVGAVGDWRPTIRAVNSYMNTSFIGFTAYAKGVPLMSSVEIFATEDNEGRQACLVATARVSPAKTGSNEK